jgi:hypothetical protein
MLKKTEIALRAARIGALAMVVGISAGLAGCDDDDGDGSSGGPNLGSASLNTPEGAKTAVGTLGALISALDTVDALSEATLPEVSAAAAAKASDECDAGGTIDDIGPRNVSSPFSTQPVAVSGSEFKDCKFEVTQGSPQNPDDTDIATTLVINGISEGGSLTDNGDVFLARVGETLQSPLSLVYNIKTDIPAQSAGGQSIPASSSNTKLDFGIFYRTDSKSTNADFNEEFILDLSGDYTVSGRASGQNFSAKGSFTSFVGKDGAPFTVTEDNSGVTISGEYGFGISPAPQGASCTSASIKVETTTPVVDSTTANGGSPFEAGVLKLTSGSTEASVQFNNDGTVTVTPAGGSATTFNYAEALAAATPCTGFAFAGLAFLGTAALAR